MRKLRALVRGGDGRHVAKSAPGTPLGRCQTVGILSPSTKVSMYSILHPRLSLPPALFHLPLPSSPSQYGLSPDAPSAAPHAPSSAPAAADGDGWERVGRNNRSAVTREVAVGRGPPTAVSGLFAGQLCSTVRADNMKPSATVQPFVVLQLDIAGADVRTVPDALAGMARAEEVQGYRAEGSKVRDER